MYIILQYYVPSLSLSMIAIKLLSSETIRSSSAGETLSNEILQRCVWKREGGREGGW